MRIHFFVCLLALLIGCQNPSGLEVNMYSYGDELELRLDEKVIIGAENKIVEFVDVLEDSRCPANVMCFWAGNGKVLLRFAQDDIQLNTYLEPQEAEMGDVNIQLVSLEPYPEYPGRIDKDDYKIRLLITRE